MELITNGFTDAAGPQSAGCADAAFGFGGEPGAAPGEAAVERLLALGQAAALAPNTRRSYGVGWRNWCLWAWEQGVAAFPASPDDLQRWLATLGAEGKKPSTLRAYKGAVDYQHRHHLGPNPARDPEVRDLVSGLRRLAAAQGHAPRQAFGLRSHHIPQIADAAYKPRNNQPGGRKETARQARQRGDLDIAMVCVAHDALLRCAELLALTWADIDLPTHGGLGTVRIQRSKTDQNANGATATISAYTCQALARLKPHDAAPQDPVFPLSPNTVTRRLKAAAQAAGIDPTNITSHSPRVGMAQDLAAAGTDIAGIMQAGRWTTPATVARYIQNLAAHHTPAAQHLKTQQHTPQEPSPPKPPAKNPSPLHTPTARLHPTAQNTARKALTLANYTMKSLLKTLAALSPQMRMACRRARRQNTHIAAQPHLAHVARATPFGPIGLLQAQHGSNPVVDGGDKGVR